MQTFSGDQAMGLGSRQTPWTNLEVLETLITTMCSAVQHLEDHQHIMAMTQVLMIHVQWMNGQHGLFVQIHVAKDYVTSQENLDIQSKQRCTVVIRVFYGIKNVVP